jgi:hypothetical protein
MIFNPLTVQFDRLYRKSFTGTGGFPHLQLQLHHRYTDMFPRSSGRLLSYSVTYRSGENFITFLVTSILCVHVAYKYDGKNHEERLYSPVQCCCNTINTEHFINYNHTNILSKQSTTVCFIPYFYFLFDADNSVSASFTVSSESYVRYSEKAFEALFIIFFKSLVLTFSDLNSTK